MNQPKQPEEPGTKGPTPDNGPGTENGVPDAAKEGDPKGGPNSDRHETETAANP